MKDKKKIWQMALKAVKNAQSLKDVAANAKQKTEDYESASALSNDFLDKVNGMVRMVKAHIKGAYKIPMSTLLFLVFALIYFIVPTDSIPDFVPVLGFSDDITVVYFIYRKIEVDISDYITWEKSNLSVNNSK